MSDRELLEEFSRLEAVGDLHFHAAAYTTALDYFDRIMDLDQGARIPSARMLVAVRKAVTACLHLGWAARADRLLDRGRSILEQAAGLDAAGCFAAGFDEVHLETERARLEVRQAALLLQRGDYHAALTLAKKAFTCLALTDQHLEVANLQLTMGACHQRLGRLDKAEEFYQDSLSTYRRVGDETGVAILYNALALLSKASCRWDRALSLLDRAVELAGRNGSPPLLSWFHLNRGIVLIKTGRFAEAELDLGKCLRLSQSLHDPIREAKALLAMGKLFMQTGRQALAEEHVLTAQQLARQQRMKREEIIADEYLGDLMLARGDWDKALHNFRIGLDRVRAGDRAADQAGDLEGELLRRLAEAHRLAGDLPRAVADAHAAVAVCEACGEAYEIGFCHITLGRAYAAEEDWRQADAHFRRGIELFQSQHLRREWCDAVMAFLEVRFSSADKPVLLLLRRLLLEVQEQAAAQVGDRVLAACLAGLARVQLRLGLCDDALLTVFELERIACALQDRDYLDEVVRLRRLVDAGLAHDMGRAASPVGVFHGIPGLFQGPDTGIAQHLDSILKAIRDRVDAAFGFLILGCLDPVQDPTLEPNPTPAAVAVQGLEADLAGQLGRWYHETAARSARPLVFSRLEPDAPLLSSVPALGGRCTGCVFLPIVSQNRLLGLLFLGLNGSKEQGRGLDQGDLAFLASYMAFIGLFFTEQNPLPASIAGGMETEGFESIITCDEGMLEMLSFLRKVADSNLTVLLHGETGTGKGLLAYALHRLSPRSKERFLSINCAAIPETLLESELFGHIKGSFTGADRNKSGLLSEAEGGTVFLDEIGRMPLSMQGKLLHFLDSRVVRPVGSNDEQEVDVRIVCATKTDLQQLVGSGGFLEDLYFRLLDFPLTVPPLRERPGDIPLLASHFVQIHGPELCGRVPTLSEELLDALLRYDWPGNIRELEKSLRRALVLARGEERLRVAHLPSALRSGQARIRLDGVMPLRDTLAAIEAREIRHALKASAGNKAAAARLLQISYPSLLKKINLYGLA